MIILHSGVILHSGDIEVERHFSSCINDYLGNNNFYDSFLSVIVFVVV